MTNRRMRFCNVHWESTPSYTNKLFLKSEHKTNMQAKLPWCVQVRVFRRWKSLVICVYSTRLVYTKWERVEPAFYQVGKTNPTDIPLSEVAKTQKPGPRLRGSFKVNVKWLRDICQHTCKALTWETRKWNSRGEGKPFVETIINITSIKNICICVCLHSVPNLLYILPSIC